MTSSSILSNQSSYFGDVMSFNSTSSAFSQNGEQAYGCEIKKNIPNINYSSQLPFSTCNSELSLRLVEFDDLFGIFYKYDKNHDFYDNFRILHDKSCESTEHSKLFVEEILLFFTNTKKRYESYMSPFILYRFNSLVENFKKDFVKDV